jgi:hypothetical protein
MYFRFCSSACTFGGQPLTSQAQKVPNLFGKHETNLTSIFIFFNNDICLRGISSRVENSRNALVTLDDIVALLAGILSSGLLLHNSKLQP